MSRACQERECMKIRNVTLNLSKHSQGPRGRHSHTDQTVTQLVTQRRTTTYKRLCTPSDKKDSYAHALGVYSTGSQWIHHDHARRCSEVQGPRLRAMRLAACESVRMAVPCTPPYICTPLFIGEERFRATRGPNGWVPKTNESSRERAASVQWPCRATARVRHPLLRLSCRRHASSS